MGLSAGAPDTMASSVCSGAKKIIWRLNRRSPFEEVPRSKIVALSNAADNHHSIDLWWLVDSVANGALAITPADWGAESFLGDAAISYTSQLGFECLVKRYCTDQGQRHSAAAKQRMRLSQSHTYQRRAVALLCEIEESLAAGHQQTKTQSASLEKRIAESSRSVHL
jgi:hypothetical protein